ncbi:MAG: hypothetical protein LBT49_02710, partial [Prevotellaceae bacterium]|nr:hypothetical protein [Prevotellaceae bacterium]
VFCAKVEKKLKQTNNQLRVNYELRIICRILNYSFLSTFIHLYRVGGCNPATRLSTFIVSLTGQSVATRRGMIFAV